MDVSDSRKSRSMCFSQRARRLILTPTRAVSPTRVVSPEEVTAVTVELGVSSPEDGDVCCDEMNCMRLMSRILQKVT